MGRIRDAIDDFLGEAEWTASPLPKNPDWLRMNHHGDSGHWICYLQVREEQEQFFFFSMAALFVPAERRKAVAEFITRANYGMILGNFEMDISDGEVRYKTYFDAQGFELTRKTVETHIFANLATFDRYNAGLMSVAFGEIEPETAIAKIEG